jgi:hypothetical protein
VHSRQGRGLPSCSTGYRRLICGLLGAAAHVDKWALDGWWVGPGRDSYQWWGLPVGRERGGGSFESPGCCINTYSWVDGCSSVCVGGGGCSMCSAGSSWIVDTLHLDSMHACGIRKCAH